MHDLFTKSKAKKTKHLSPFEESWSVPPHVIWSSNNKTFHFYLEIYFSHKLYCELSKIISVYWHQLVVCFYIMCKGVYWLKKQNKQFWPWTWPILLTHGVKKWPTISLILCCSPLHFVDFWFQTLVVATISYFFKEWWTTITWRCSKLAVDHTHLSKQLQKCWFVCCYFTP